MIVIGVFENCIEMYWELGKKYKVCWVKVVELKLDVIV